MKISHIIFIIIIALVVISIIEELPSIQMPQSVPAQIFINETGLKIFNAFGELNGSSTRVYKSFQKV